MWTSLLWAGNRLHRPAIRKSTSARLKLESLNARIVPATVAYGDINHDGLLDKAAITAARTVTVSLANPNGTYTVSALLTVPNNLPALQSVAVFDADADGDLDVRAYSWQLPYAYHNTWLNSGDGTFGSLHTKKLFMGNWV